MTHERAGTAAIGACALLVLAADLLYATSHWTGSFRRSFLTGLLVGAVGLALGLLFRLVRPGGSNRRAARAYQRRVNVLSVVAIAALVALDVCVGGSNAG